MKLRWKKRRLECESLEHRIALASDLFALSPDGIWESRPRIPATQGMVSYIQPSRFTATTLNSDSLASVLASAPLEFNADASPLVLTLPTPDNQFHRFAVVESPIMEPALAAEFPDIKTFAGQGIDDPAATLRFDITPAGFHAQVLSPNGAYYIDPFWHLDDSIYVSYFKTDLVRSSDPLFVEHFEIDAEHEKETALISAGIEAEAEAELPSNDLSALKEKIASEQLVFSTNKGGDGPQLMRAGTQLRTYRAAVAATGEYTAFHGGTVALGQAAIVTAMNRVTGIYELELSVRMVLVANNSSLVYTNAATDPYTNGNPSSLISQNQSNIDAVIGNSNYDIGHVFSTGGGGLAGLGVVGVTGQKARGETGTGAPIGDPFYVDYVAHEMGHQFGGNHTFNGTQGSCSGNRNASTAYEPGSGSSIQAYAGICGADDLQSNSDPYFHSVSFDEIVQYTTTGSGNSAAAITNTLNNVPRVNAGVDFVIPSRTPFILSAAGVDSDSSDALTYSWEQRDLGAAQTVSAADNGSSPLFRAFSPTLSTDRIFPRLTSLVNNTTVVGEKLPTLSRTMKFRATVRDNRSGGGGVNTDDMVVTVVDTGSAFAVTDPNAATTWTVGTPQTINWNVANTNAAPINTANVNIHLSIDGGLTYPILLASDTPNDGSHSITVPNVTTTAGRIRVASSNSIFFDISNANFTITGGTNSPPTITAIENRVSTMGATTGPISFTIGDAQTAANDLIITATSSNTTLVPSQNITVGGSGSARTVSVQGASGQFGQTTISLNVTDAGGLTTQESFILMFDKVVVCTAYESFDSVTTPNLPAGWTRSATGVTASNWVTSPASSASAPNNVFVSNPSNTSDSVLVSPVFQLNDSNSQIAFRNNYSLENNYDGGVLEISVAGGPFIDVLTAGGSFVTGGYSGVLDSGFGNPIGGRQAWTGASPGYIDTIVDLPDSAKGSNVQLRWRMGADTSAALTGWRVDSIQTCGVPSNTAPTAISLNPASANLAENTSTVSGVQVATISVTDDGAGTNVLSLSGLDAASFEIVGNALRVAPGVQLNFEAKQTYNVTVSVDDSSVGSTPDQSANFVLNVADVNEPPTIASTLPQVNGNVLTNFVNTGTWSDPESANVDLAASIGTIIKNANGTWNWSYTPSSIVTNQTVTVTATDAGNLVASSTFQLNALAYVSSAQVLYRGSDYFELFGVSGALETQKTFLQAGALPQTTSINNVVNYALGINAVVLNIPGLAASALTVPDDLVLRVAPAGVFGNVTPLNWSNAPTPTAIGILAGTSTTAAQVQIQWPDNAIQNTWLQIIVNANANTGLSQRAVYYIGHAMGDIVGDSPYRVTAVDLSAVQSAISTTIVPVSDPKDFNKDRRVTAFDLSFVQSRIATTVLLQDITIPVAGTIGEGEQSSRLLATRSHSGACDLMSMTEKDAEAFYSELGRKKLLDFGI
jgi:hypothetical protein